MVSNAIQVLKHPNDATAINLSKRERRSSVQYLFVEEGNSVDDAHWSPLSSLAKQRMQSARKEGGERMAKELGNVPPCHNLQVRSFSSQNFVGFAT